MAASNFSRHQAYRPGDEIVPGYVLVRRIGGGGFGDVWEAQAPGRIRVAIKVIEGLSGAVGGKEYRGLMVVKGVSHPNLCQISAFWLKDEHGRVLTDSECEALLAAGSQEATSAASFSRPQQLIIAMQLGNESLFDRLNACQQEEMEGIPVQELLSYLEDASKAIDLLNGKYKIQHCDIKPQNILLLNGAPLVCDFGLARSLDDLQRSTTLTYSPAYGAPELYDGHETMGTDQYSLAISYVELRTGRLPFTKLTPTAVMKAKITGDLDLSSLPERERSVIERGTALDPAERFPSCREMVKALLRAVESVPTAEDEIVPGFKLVREIGAGAYGTVWEGRAPGEIPVAIKILEMEESAGRMEFRGLQSIKSINHPNLCPIFGIWLKDEFGRILEQSEGAAFALDTIGDVPPEIVSGESFGRRGTDRLGQSDTDADRLDPAAATPVGSTLQPGSERILSGSRRESDAERGSEAGRKPSHVRLLVAMSLAETSLAQRLQESQTSSQPGIPRQELLGYFQDAAKAIDFLNREHQMRHGDVKPANLLLAGNSVQVCDFGLAQPLGKTRSRVLCTPAYAAPEIHAGESSETSDMYSLAISYCELRTGRLPYRDTITEEELASVKRQHALELGGLPRRVRAVMYRATAPEPDQRYPTCKDMVRALANAEVRRRMPVLGFLLALTILAAVAAPVVWNLWRRAELLDRWGNLMADKVYTDAIALIPSFSKDDQEERWRAVQGAMTEEAVAYAKSGEFAERVKGLGVYDHAATILADRPESALRARDDRDALAEELLAAARSQYKQRSFAAAAADLTELGHRLATLDQGPSNGLERLCQEAFVLAASALFFADPASVQDPTRAPWGEIEDRLRSVPRPDALQPGDNTWIRYHCLRTQQARAELKTQSWAQDSLLSPLSTLMTAAPAQTALQEYGITDLMVQARDQVIVADDATVEQLGSYVNRIWPGLAKIRSQLRQVGDAMDRGEWSSAAELLDKVDALRKDKYAAVPGLELIVALRQLELAVKRPAPAPTPSELTGYLEIVARCGVGEELYESCEKILHNLEIRLDQGLSVRDLDKPRQFLDAPGLAERLPAEQLAQLRGWASRLEVLGVLAETERPGPELVDLCEQLRKQSAANAVTDAALVEATLLGGAENSAATLSPVQLAALAGIADAAYESAGQNPAQTGAVFAGYPAYVRALVWHRRGLPATGELQLADLLNEALQAASHSATADSRIASILARPPRVAASVQLLLATAEGLEALPHDTFLPANLDEVKLGQATHLLKLAASWVELLPAPRPSIPAARRVATWQVIAAAFGSPWASPAAEQADWSHVARTVPELQQAEGIRSDDPGPPTTHTLQLVLGLAHAALVRAGAAAGQPETAWRTLAEAFGGFDSARRVRGANISQQALYDWIIQPAVSIHSPSDASTAPAAAPGPADLSLARLYIAKANLLQVPGEVRSKFAAADPAGGPDQAAFAAYEQAEKLLQSDPAAPRRLLAETQVQQFYLRLRMIPEDGRMDMQTLGGLVVRALEADPQYPSAIGVRAHWALETSRSVESKADRLRELAAAVKTYDEAVSLQEATKESNDDSASAQRDLRLLLEGRSAAQLEAAFYARDQRDRKAEHLAAALHDAALALLIDDNCVAEPAEAYVKLGNALEDHAYYLQDAPLPADIELTNVLQERIGHTLPDAAADKPGEWQSLKFLAADATFAKALEYTMTTEKKAFVQLYRGRARYRSALSTSRRDPAAATQSLRDARDDLTDAVSEGALRSLRYRAEAFHWRGELMEFSGEYAEALTCYETATKLAKDIGAAEWTQYQLAWADLLSQQADGGAESLEQASKLADEVLQKVGALSLEGFKTIELAANCKGRRREKDQVEFIARFLPATPPAEGEERRAYWMLAHLRSWWACYRVSDRTKYEAERAQAKAVRDGCRTVGDSALAGHGEGIYGLWTLKWVKSLRLGDSRLEPANQEAFDALVAAVRNLHAAGEYRVYTADYANALADQLTAALRKPVAATPDKTVDIQARKDAFRQVMQPLSAALVHCNEPTRRLFKESQFDELLGQ